MSQLLFQSVSEQGSFASSNILYEMSSRLILITGANRGKVTPEPRVTLIQSTQVEKHFVNDLPGIGFATVQALGLRSPSDHFILGCRNKQNGDKAASQLRDLGVQSNVDVFEVDLTCDDSLVAFAKAIEDTYGKLDGKPCAA